MQSNKSDKIDIDEIRNQYAPKEPSSIVNNREWIAASNEREDNRLKQKRTEIVDYYLRNMSRDTIEENISLSLVNNRDAPPQVFAYANLSLSINMHDLVKIPLRDLDIYFEQLKTPLSKYEKSLDKSITEMVTDFIPEHYAVRSRYGRYTWSDVFIIEIYDTREVGSCCIF